VKEYFTAAGVDFGVTTTQGQLGAIQGVQNGKALFFNDRTGLLMVRASLEDLDIIKSAIETLNADPPQVSIEAKFTEITQDDSKALGFDWFLGNTLLNHGSIGASGGTAPSYQGNSTAANPSGIFPGPAIPTGDPFTPFIGGIAPSASDGLLTSGLAGNDGIPAVATVTGILTDPQFRVVIRALEQRSGADILSAPKVTTLSGRQAQVEVLDLVRVVTDVDLQQQGSGGGGGNNNNDNGGTGVVGSTIEYTTQSLPFGPVLDVLPSVSADGYSIQMTLIPTITEFIGYDDPGLFVPQAQSVGGATVGIPLTAQLPLPRFRLRQVTTSCNVWDGQTVMLGGLITDNISKVKDKVPVLGDLPFLGRLFRSESSTSAKRNLMIFVTPTIIDPAGNRVHTDEEMPFARVSVPVQPAPVVTQ
jgi:general secretion pathway protein D